MKESYRERFGNSVGNPDLHKVNPIRFDSSGFFVLISKIGYVPQGTCKMANETFLGTGNFRVYFTEGEHRIAFKMVRPAFFWE